MGLGQYAKYATLGISFVVTTAVYLFLGYRAGIWLDQRFGTEPVFFVTGIVFGMVLSLVSFAKELLALERERTSSAATGVGENDVVDSEKNNLPMTSRPTDPYTSPKGKEEGK